MQIIRMQMRMLEHRNALIFPFGRSSEGQEIEEINAKRDEEERIAFVLRVGEIPPRA